MLIKQFDHAVILVNDEPRAREFYVDCLGAEVKETVVRERPGGNYNRSFLSLRRHGQVLGLFEDSKKVPPARIPRDWPAVVYSLPRQNFDEVRARLAGVASNMQFPGGTATTFYTFDSEGNPVGFSPNDGNTTELLRLEVDVPDIDQGATFYGDILGLGDPETGLLPDRSPYAWFPVGERGQSVLLTERPDAPGGNPGHHFAFLVGHAEHAELKANLKSRGIPDIQLRSSARGQDEEGTYIRDPWGRALQWVTHSDA
jgi:catechol 2,3-dioxygenase-like lactoylglutathione lyase family enzyme